MEMKRCCCGHRKEEIAETAETLKLLAEESRLEILCVLKNDGHCVCEIIDHLGLPQNLVSHHLKKMKGAGLVLSKKEGLWVHYFLTDKGKRAAENIFKIN